MTKIRLALILSSVALSAVSGKDRDWQNGVVLDSAASPVQLSGSSRTSIDGHVDADGNLHADGRTTAAQMREFAYKVQGEQFTYVVEQTTIRPAGGLLTRGIAARRHCRLIVGESVKYAQRKSAFYVIDADGKECKLEVIRQEQRTAIPAAPQRSTR